MLLCSTDLSIIIMFKFLNTLLTSFSFIFLAFSAPTFHAGHGLDLDSYIPRSAGSDLLIPSNPPVFWYESITHNGTSPFVPGGDKWKVFRNVATEYHADKSGKSDAQPALQRAINGMRPSQTIHREASH